MSNKKMVRISGESKFELDELVKEANKDLPDTHKEITQEWMLGNLIRNEWLKVKGYKK